jgi:UDP-N-acetylmuramoyl-tripeptide--D-alanyl-D-alanine ligase
VSLPGLCLIDDTYNANPAAMRVALDNLVRVAARLGGRPVAVLGDMRELGPQERLFHRQTGEYAAAAGVELLWGVGTLAESTAAGFQDARAGGQAGHVASPAETSPVEASLHPGDVVLFKASRGVKLEQMVDRIAEEARAGRWAGHGSSG